MKRFSPVIFASLVATTAAAQAPLKARPLGTIKSISKETVVGVNGVRQLPDGSILVNDVGRRRLVLLDSTLQGTVVIADTAAGAANMYGSSGGTLLPYVADSSLFLDLAAQSFVVIDPKGKVVRVMSVPRSNDMFNLMQGSPGFDAKGRMVYRTNYPRAIQRTADGMIQQAPAPDSQPIIRVNLETRKVDTIATVRVAKMTSISQTTSTGMTMVRQVPPPLPLVDDWSVLENGSVAMLRGQDYHIDWILADESKKSTGKVAFDWRRLTDDDKIALVDSINTARANASTAGGPAGGAAPMMMFNDGGGMTVTRGGGGDGGGRGGNVQVFGGGGGAPAPSAPPAAASSPAPAATAPTTPASSASPATTASASAPAPASPTGPANAANAAAANAARPAPANAAAPQPVAPQGSPDVKPSVTPGAARATEMDKVAGMASMLGSLPALPAPAAADLPDYMPPFRAGAVRPDRDSNIWVQTSITSSAPGNIIYDVIDSKGALADRIEIPKGYTIVGFGHGGGIFLTHREANGAMKVVRAQR